jgi:hypothetical protein
MTDQRLQHLKKIFVALRQIFAANAKNHHDNSLTHRIHSSRTHSRQYRCLGVETDRIVLSHIRFHIFKTNTDANTDICRI